MTFYPSYILALMRLSYKWVGIGLGWDGSLCGVTIRALLCDANKFSMNVWPNSEHTALQNSDLKV